MSKQEKLLSALTNVRDEFIEESRLSDVPESSLALASLAAVRRRRMLGIGIAAALVCAVGLVSAGLLLRRSDSSAVSGQAKWETKYVHQTMDRVEEIVRIPTWEEMSPTQRYPEVQYRGVWYSSSGNVKGAVVPADRLGDALGEAQLTGYDIYTDQNYTVSGKLYAIDGIDSACAVAVLMADQTEAYAYMNHYYQPATLGDLLDALSLEQNLIFGSVYIEERDQSGDVYTVEFPEVSAEKLWTLLADRDALCTSSAEYEEIFTQKKRFSVSVSVPLLGISNLSLSVTEDGWLDTNLMGQGHAFFIGNEAADAFLRYLMTECTGYRWVYDVLTDGEVVPVPEAGGEEFTDTVIAVTSTGAKPMQTPKTAD